MLSRLLRRVTNVREDELSTSLWAAALFFVVL